MKFIAGDIGGTKTVLAIYDYHKGLATPLAEDTFPSAAYPNLAAIVRTFLAQQHGLGADFAAATFGVAGPVVNGRATITNLPWRMDEKQLAANFPAAGDAHQRPGGHSQRRSRSAGVGSAHDQ
ncbi:MAG: glucokinase [Caldilineaceae bacterium]